MSRRLLLASLLSLPLLATACSDAPEPPADLSFQGAGLADDGVWYLPGHEDTLTVWSADPGRPSWTFLADGAIELAATSPVHGEAGSTAFLRAAEIGSGTVTLLDGDGAPIAELETHVTYPDRILLSGDGDDGPYRMGNSARILRGDSVTLRVEYAHLDRTLAGTGLIEGSEHAVVERQSGREWVVLTATTPRHEAWMSAGPDASYVVDVQPIEPADLQFRLLSSEPNLAPGATATLRPQLRLAEGGELVLHSAGWWTRDGEPVSSIGTYTYDPNAAASTIEVRIGRGDATMVATAVIHAAP